MLVFEERRKQKLVPGEKSLEAEQKTNKPNQNMMLRLGMEPEEGTPI